MTIEPGRVLPITVFGNPVLHRPAAKVEVFDDELRQLVADMFATMYATGNGVGLAAPQVGVGLQVFVFDCGEDQVGHVVNPALDRGRGPLQHGDEGCLSVPGIWLDTPRYLHARVRGVDQDGNEVAYEGDGLLGRCLQHEVGHLKGELFLGRHPKSVQREMEAEIRTTDWFARGSIDPSEESPQAPLT